MSDKTTTIEERLKTSEVIRYYKISRTTLWRMRQEGVLKPVGRIGKKELVYLKKDIEACQSSML